ncbi:MAG: ArsR family transcriptional regulator [Clostridia bacterium]|nr:ArsR family transcriptional regulator [Clostridia bacterium]
MTNEEDLKRFIKSFMEITQSLRSTDFYDRENSKKLHALQAIHKFEEENGKQMTISDISRITGIAMPNVSRFLRPLEESGYIERQRIGRTVYLHITADGDQLLAAKMAEMSDYLSEMLEALTEEEKAAYLTCSEKISAALHNIIEQTNKTGVN